MLVIEIAAGIVLAWLLIMILVGFWWLIPPAIFAVWAYLHWDRVGKVIIAQLVLWTVIMAVAYIWEELT